MPVGRLAVPIEVVEATTLYPVVAELFRPESVTSVAVCDSDDPRWIGLISRERHTAVSAGTLGYGRALLARRQVGEVVDRSPLAVPQTMPVVEVVRLAMARPEARRFDDVVVYGAVWQVVTVPTLVRALADAVTTRWRA
ncbi:hypothetical protein [Sanguibacter massiliensis]|uniref:hypothetical protein n=1 Tax=Sanguibacter massiliensis TaxID=1973217 RepID=UPI00101AE485|nr:hypothetical protein [Sanguibacter massiliensis]